MQNRKKIIGVGVFIILGIGSVWILKNSFTPSKGQATLANQRVTCSSSKAAKTITINMQGFSPQKTTFHACDILTFQNIDTKYHQPAFGDHPKHLIYPGYPDEPLKPKTSRSVVLTIAGKFPIHDHIYDELEGEIDILQ